MDTVLSDLSNAFSAATHADRVYVLLPLLVVAIAQGLRTGGVSDMIEKAGSGLLWLGLFNFFLRGLMSDARLDPANWSAQLERSWSNLMDFRFMEVLGFWLLLLAGIALIFTVRSVLRR